MIKFGFTNLRFERTDPQDRFDLLLGVIADLALEAENRLLYSEPDFPVTELAAQLQAWCADGLGGGEDFEFASMESDEQGLVWFRGEGAGYRVGSLYQEFLAMAIYSPEEVRSSIHRFFVDLRERSRRELGIDLNPVLEP